MIVLSLYAKKFSSNHCLSSTFLHHVSLSLSLSLSPSALDLLSRTSLFLCSLKNETNLHKTNINIHGKHSSKAQQYVSSCCCQEDGSIPEQCEAGGTNEQASYKEVEVTGDYEQCYICDYTPYLYPGNPQNAMQVRYLGDYSCSELFTIGLQGKIPNYLCLPMQADDLLQETCGCSISQGATYKGPNQGKWSIGRKGKKGKNNNGKDGANWFSSIGFGGKGNGNGGGSSNNGYNTRFAGGRMSAMEILITLLVIVGILVWIAAIMKRTKRTRSLNRRESLETDLV